MVGFLVVCLAGSYLELVGGLLAEIFYSVACGSGLCDLFPLTIFKLKYSVICTAYLCP